MQYRTLGKTGLSVSRMGFGGIPIQRIDKEGTRKLIHQLMDAGVNYIDTARAYTVSEEYLGYALEGIRDKFILATKSPAATKDAMEKDLAISMEKLNTDYIDLYQFHNPSPANFETIIAPGGALEALQQAKREGRIGHIGLTTHSVELLRRALELDWVETVMFPYNIVETQCADILPLCTEKNIGFIDMKPLAGGAIEDATLALRFVLANEHVTLTIPGMAEPGEAEQNLAAAADDAPLTDAELQACEAVRAQLGTNFCRRCNYCAPCPQGIPIYSVFLMEGYLTRYGLESWARDRYEGLAGHASDCVGCGTCETRCPYNLPIRDMMAAAAKKFGK